MQILLKIKLPFAMQRAVVARSNNYYNISKFTRGHRVSRHILSRRRAAETGIVWEKGVEEIYDMHCYFGTQSYFYAEPE